jgi:hypothetical protein
MLLFNPAAHLRRRGREAARGRLYRQNTAHFNGLAGFARLENRVPIFKCFDYITSLSRENGMGKPFGVIIPLSWMTIF